MKKLLDEIKDMEKEHEKKLELARKNKEIAITDAKKESIRVMTEGKDKISKKIDDKIAKKEETLQQEKAKVADQGRKDASSIKKKAEKNREKAVNFVLDMFNKNA